MVTIGRPVVESRRLPDHRARIAWCPGADTSTAGDTSASLHTRSPEIVNQPSISSAVGSCS